MAPPLTLVFRTQRIHLPIGSHEIGRSEACTIVLDDPHVSRRHAMLHIAEDRVVVSDLGSRGGTRINGILVGAPQVAVAGDVLVLGKVSFDFVDSSSTAAHAAGPSALHGFTACSGCGYLVFKKLKWCPVCNFALQFDDREDTTAVRHHAPPTMTLPVPRAAIIVTHHEQMLRGLNEWITNTSDSLVMVYPSLERARAQINAGRCTVIVDLDLVETDEGASLRELVGQADPAMARFVVMGPAEVDWPARAATYGLKGIRGYVPRLSSPIDLLGRLHRLRIDEDS